MIQLLFLVSGLKCQAVTVTAVSSYVAFMDGRTPKNANGPTEKAKENL